MPAMGVARTYHDPELEDVRMWRVAGVEIIRVIHGKRDIEELFGG